MDFIQKRNRYFVLIIWLISLPIGLMFADDNYFAYEDYVLEIRGDFAKQMEKEWNLSCEGMGGSMQEKVEEISLDFAAHLPATIDESRALIVLVTEKLAQKINDHEEIRPYLQEYPFPPGRLEVTITFYDRLKNPRADGSVMRVFHVGSSATTSHKDHLVYYAQNAFSGRSVKIFEESYSEALKLVKASGLEVPPEHQITQLELGTDEMTMAFAKKMAENGIKASEVGGKMQGSVEEVGARLNVFYPATKENAREITVFAIESLLKIVNSNEKLRPHLIEYPFTSAKVNMAIDFTNERYSPYFDGKSMVNVLIEGNEVFYYHHQKDPTSNYSTVLLEKEPYEQALKRIENTSSEPKLSKNYSWQKTDQALWQKAVNFLTRYYYTLLSD